MHVFVVAAGRLPLAPCSRPPTPELGLSWQKGLYHDVTPIALAAHCAKGVVERLSGFDPNMVSNIVWGCANPTRSQNGNLGRLIAIHNGWGVPGFTVNQLCASSMEAQIIAAGLLSSHLFGSKNQPQVILVGGIEKMSDVPLTTIFDDLTPNSIALLGPRACGMGLTAETLAVKHGITRDALDAFAVEENRRARFAISEGLFDEEIVPITIGEQEITRDVLPDELTLEIAKKKGRLHFDAKGVVTQFGSSQMTDGAAALVLCNQAALDVYGWKPLARFMGGATVAVHPDVMGEGAIEAVETFFARNPMAADDIAIHEVNTAFAPIPLAYAKHFNIPLERINTCGGATALGHPLGATGARLAVTAIHIGKRLKASPVLATMCVGMGQGAVGVYEIL